MVSWFKNRNTNGDKSEYEPLYPLPPPRRGQTQMLKYVTLCGVLCLGVVAVIVVLVLNGAETPVTTENVTNDGAAVAPVLLKATAAGNEVPTMLTIADRNPTRPRIPFPAFEAEEEDSARINWRWNRGRGKVSTTTTTIAPLLVEEEDILVEVDQGVLRGTKMKSRSGREFLAFMGIPYAKPPLGELRFQPPVEAEPWEGVLNATKIPLECIQKDKYNLDPEAVKGHEDCLYLNVYVPKKYDELRRRRHRFPVMLYIHGGGPYGNASRYGPNYFMDEDVVLIMMNYRLGILGNFNTNDTAATGNQGLRDQIMAMEWIQDNIKRFGGDRDRVTLFGNSYGAIDVHVHILSPASKGLFHRAICESGVMLDPQVLNENPSKTAFEFGPKVNCTTSNSTELVECLRNVPANELASKSHLDAFTMSIDFLPEDGDKDDQIIPEHPLTRMQEADYNNIPVIFGVNSGEALSTSLPILNNATMTQMVNEHFNAVMTPLLKKIGSTATDPEIIVDAAHQFYFGGKNVSRETEANFTALLSDRSTIHMVMTSANFQAMNNRRRKHVYLYYFNWEVAKKYSRVAEATYQPDHFLGAAHADELQMLFPYDDFPYIPLDSVHANLSLTMVKLWATFAADGVPSGTANEWEPIKADQKPFKLFELNSNSLKMIDPIGERMAFWDQWNLTDLYVTKDPLHPVTATPP